VNVSKLAAKGDFFDDEGWTVLTQNFARFAKALKGAGIRGIFFDNECYSPNRSLFDHPLDCDYTATHSLDEYRAQARKRGREIMQGMMAEYPDIVVLFAHGPYISAPVFGPEGCDTNPFVPRQSSPNSCELLGPFTVGFMEGKGALATVVDGGEEYKFRTQAHFYNSYNARKVLMGTDAFDCSFVPPQLRGSEWSNHISISFGVMAEDWPAASLTMTPSELHECMTRALQKADRYTWLYTGTRNRRFMTPGGVAQEWMDAAWAARDAVPYR
jgi:hypothetical protein